MTRELHQRALGGLGAAMLLALLSAGCAGMAGSRLGPVEEATSLRAGLAGQDVPALAPQAFAAAEEELARSRAAQAAGDKVSAELLADRAIAAFSQAVAQARLARALQEEVAAREALASASEQATSYAARRQAIDREADDVEKKLRVAREALSPPASGPADPERESARLIAARALVTQARLLCSAARLVSSQAPGLAEAEAAVKQLEAQSDASGRLGIDPAARVRAACLASLTKARRSATGSDPTDALLAELSAQLSSEAAPGRGGPEGLTPSRDERGVVVTVRSVWKGDRLTPEAEASLRELGRVAAAHPAFAVQVVLHEAQAQAQAQPRAAEAAATPRRAEALTQALAAGGAAAARMKIEHAGARAPIVDPNDARHRERNARVEVVFVSPGG